MNHPRHSSAKRLQYGLPALAAIALAFSIVSAMEGNPGRQAMSPPILPPESPFAESIAGFGVVEPKTETISIATQLNGIINRVYVVDGERVKSGEPLFSLDAREYHAQLQDAAAAVDAHRAALDKIGRLISAQQAVIQEQQARLEAARAQQELDAITYERNKTMLRSQLIARQAFDAVTANEGSAQANVNAEAARLIACQRYSEVLEAEQTQASAELRESQAEQDRAAIIVEQSVVRAPIDGTILKVNIHAGEYAQSGMLQTPLLAMGAIDQLYLRVEVDQEDAWRITPGAQAVAMVRGNPKLQIPLRFVRIEPAIVPKHFFSGSDDRVDTRDLQAIYSFSPSQLASYVGQQLDVFIAVSSANSVTPN